MSWTEAHGLERWTDLPQSTLGIGEGGGGDTARPASESASDTCIGAQANRQMNVV